MNLKQNITDRERCISLINACTDKEVKTKWIIEMANSEIECSESQCDSCLISKDCISTMEVYNG